MGHRAGTGPPGWCWPALLLAACGDGAGSSGVYGMEVYRTGLMDLGDVAPDPPGVPELRVVRSTRSGSRPRIHPAMPGWS